jgi:hypothetical protein
MTSYIPSLAAPYLAGQCCGRTPERLPARNRLGVVRITRRGAGAAAVGAVLAIVLELGLPLAIRDRLGVGPTAAAVDSGFLFMVGAALGVVLGGVLGAIIAGEKRAFSSRFESGMHASWLATALGVAPVVVILERGELLPTAASLFAVVGFGVPLAALGAVIGASVTPILRRLKTR